MLDKQCKKAFEEWVIKAYTENDYYDFNICETTGLLRFYESYWKKLPFSMQWGIYVDFFDSVGKRIKICDIDGELWWYKINNSGHYKDSLTRNQARKEAITKANELMNKKLKNQ